MVMIGGLKANPAMETSTPPDDGAEPVDVCRVVGTEGKSAGMKGMEDMAEAS
jgi:hypothetical protein